MATNTTNSNFVNISNLPKAQIANNTDTLILETQNGTQTIEFQNFNVVRTDAAGNATVTGDISGGKADFIEIQADTLRATEIFSSNEQGVSNAYAYQNIFKTTNGIIVSSDYVVGSPEYLTLYNLYVTLSANSSQNFKKVFEYNGTASINNGSIVSSLINVGGFPPNTGGTSVGSLIGNSSNYPSFFTITPYSLNNSSPVPATVPVLSGFQYFPGSGIGDDYLLFCVGLGSVNSTGSTLQFGVRLVYFYN